MTSLICYFLCFCFDFQIFLRLNRGFTYSFDGLCVVRNFFFFPGKMTLVSEEKACRVIHSWTFCELVGAFLDLGIAYLLLCASTLAYFASKFLGLFGLCLPCPCKGLFGSPNNSHRLQRALMDYPREKTSSVQLSVKSMFPFNLIWVDDPNCQFNLGWMDERNRKNKHVEMEGEASSSSYREKAQDFVERSLVESYERFDLKGKRAAGQRKRLGLRQRHKRRAFDYGKSFTVSSHDPLCLEAKDGRWTPPSVCKIGTEITEEGCSVPVNSGGDGLSCECYFCFELSFQSILLKHFSFFSTSLNLHFSHFSFSFSFSFKALS